MGLNHSKHAIEIEKIESRKSSAATRSNPPSEISFGVSLRASSEGFPNADLGISKQKLPVKAFSDMIARAQIPKLFAPSRSFRPGAAADSALFQGRADILDQIKKQLLWRKTERTLLS